MNRILKSSTKNSRARFHKADLHAAAALRTRIAEVRKAQGKNAERVARAIGISRPFYTQLEGGSRRLSVEYLSAISRVLDVPMAELLTPNVEQPNGTPPTRRIRR